jgi:hypothetical protein
MNKIENVNRIVSKVGEKVGHFYLESGTTIEEAEKMCMEFIQIIGVMRLQHEQQQAMLKAQQETQAAQPEESKVIDLPEGAQNV